MTMTRREAIGHVAGAGLGFAAALHVAGGLSSPGAQAPPIPAAPPPPGDPRFPMVPSWKAEFRKLGPDVFEFDNWIGPERVVMNTVRLYNELRGTGGPDYDVEGTRRATEEYNAILAGRTG